MSLSLTPGTWLVEAVLAGTYASAAAGDHRMAWSFSGSASNI